MYKDFSIKFFKLLNYYFIYKGSFYLPFGGMLN